MRQAKTCDLQDWTDLLTESELNNLYHAEDAWVARYGTIPHDDPVAIYSATQNPDACYMSSTPYKFPALLHSGTPKLWSWMRKKWFAGIQKLALHGLPATQAVADILGVPCMNGRALTTSHRLTGNGMHCPNMGSVTATVMATVELLPEWDPTAAAEPLVRINVVGQPIPRETPLMKLQRHIHTQDDCILVSVPAWKLVKTFAFEKFGDESDALKIAQEFLDVMRKVVRGLFRFVAPLQHQSM